MMRGSEMMDRECSHLQRWHCKAVLLSRPGAPSAPSRRPQGSLTAPVRGLSARSCRSQQGPQVHRRCITALSCCGSNLYGIPAGACTASCRSTAAFVRAPCCFQAEKVHDALHQELLNAPVRSRSSFRSRSSVRAAQCSAMRQSLWCRLIFYRRGDFKRVSRAATLQLHLLE